MTTTFLAVARVFVRPSAPYHRSRQMPRLFIGRRPTLRVRRETNESSWVRISSHSLEFLHRSGAFIPQRALTAQLSTMPTNTHRREPDNANHNDAHRPRHLGCLDDRDPRWCVAEPPRVSATRLGCDPSSRKAERFNDVAESCQCRSAGTCFGRDMLRRFAESGDAPLSECGITDASLPGAAS
jgi:hypothetical protein